MPHMNLSIRRSTRFLALSIALPSRVSKEVHGYGLRASIGVTVPVWVKARQFPNVRIKSAFPLIATIERTSPIGREVPKQTCLHQPYFVT